MQKGGEKGVELDDIRVIRKDDSSGKRNVVVIAFLFSTRYGRCPENSIHEKNTLTLCVPDFRKCHSC